MTDAGEEPAAAVAGGAGLAGVVRKRLPVLVWAARYDRTAAVADLVAGVTLGLTLVPQSIAYASLANLPVQYGLYSAFVGTMLYTFLGTVKEVSIGPTSLMALLTLQTCRGLPVEFVVLLTFLSGCIVFLMGLLRLGFLVELISPAVTSGFTSATAVIIVAAQLKGLLGLSFVAETLVENVACIAAQWRAVRPPDAALAAVCCAVLLLLRKIKELPVNPKRHRVKKVLWLVSIARNAIVVCAASVFAYCTYDPDKPLLKLSGRVEAGLPPLGLPAFSARVGNETVGFGGMAARLGSGLLLLPVVMVLANIAIAKAFSVGGRVDATQEMVTLGLCNVAGSFAHAMPTCGAFTRSAVSHSSGVRSPAASLYSGVITLLALNFLTQYFFYIPKACLSSVLICAVIFMIDIEMVLELWRGGPSGGRRELATCALTFLVGVGHSVELAVLAGAAAHLVAFLHDTLAAPPTAHVLKSAQGGAFVLRPRRALVYVNAERVAARLIAAATPLAPGAPGAPGGTPPRFLMVDCSALVLVDYNAVQVLTRLGKRFKGSDQQLVVFNASGEAEARLLHVGGADPRLLRARTPHDALALLAAPPAAPPAPPAPPRDTDALLHDAPV